MIGSLMVTILLWILAIALVLAGLAGLVLPALPAVPLVFAGLLLAAWAENFAYVGWLTLGGLAVLGLLGAAADLAAGAFGARRFGASPRAALGAVLGALIGLFFGIPGVLIGPFIGAVAGELSARGNLRIATRAGIGTLVGLLLGVAAKAACSLAMIGVFIAARFLGGE